MCLVCEYSATSNIIIYVIVSHAVTESPSQVSSYIMGVGITLSSLMLMSTLGLVLGYYLCNENPKSKVLDFIEKHFKSSKKLENVELQTLVIENNQNSSNEDKVRSISNMVSEVRTKSDLSRKGKYFAITYTY